MLGRAGGAGAAGGGRARGGGAWRPISSSEFDWRETKRWPSASGLGNLPVLAPLAAGNSLQATAGSGLRGSSCVRAGRGLLRDTALNWAPGGLRCGVRPASRAGPLACALARRAGPALPGSREVEGPWRLERSERQAPRRRGASSRESFSRFLNFVPADSVRAPGPRRAPSAAYPVERSLRAVSGAGVAGS